MSSSHGIDHDVAVIGAGPHGLATAAYLRDAGLDVRVFGEPMEFWRDAMPEGMLLRSAPRASNIASPGRRLSLEAWAADEGGTVTRPLPLADFVRYGLWYQRRAVPDVDRRRVRQVAPDPAGYRLVLDDGDELRVRTVVVAAGIAPFPRIPAPFLPHVGAGASHVVDHRDLGVFAGRRVAVVGGGQSALETAALLHERRAEVELIARTPQIFWLSAPPPDGVERRRTPLLTTPPTDVGGRVSGWSAASPDLFRLLPRRVQPNLAYRAIRPAGAHWLRDRVAPVAMTLGSSVTSVETDGRVHLSLSDGSRREVDHVLLATGYAIDVRRYPFLTPALLDRVRLDGGYPVLRRGLESSVPGLHFAGAPAAQSFGPVMRFVTGTWYDAPAIAERIAGARRRLRPRWAF